MIRLFIFLNKINNIKNSLYSRCSNGEIYSRYRMTLKPNAIFVNKTFPVNIILPKGSY